MPKYTLKLSGKVDINTLVNQIGSVIKAALNRSNFCNQVQKDGGRFVSAVNGNQVVAAYYHPSKFHSATADGGIGGGGAVRSTANAGEWAVAVSSAGIGGRKTYYGFS